MMPPQNMGKSDYPRSLVRAQGKFRISPFFWIILVLAVVFGTHFYRKYVQHAGFDATNYATEGESKLPDPNLLRTQWNATGGVPVWKILVLIYNRTQFNYFDKYGNEHRFRSAMTPEEYARIEPAVRRYFQDELPIISSGHVRAQVTVKTIAHPLDNLVDGCGYYPGEAATKRDVDPGYDSVLVFWDSSGVNEATGRLENPHQCGGLTPSVGARTTYTTITIDRLPPNQRNVIKHEWGHSVLFYFNDIGKSPRPTVTNHIDRTENVYINCQSGQFYILEDETDERPIANSIYNNHQGFTHDYMSGLVAKPDRPTTCLGIPANAWFYLPSQQR